MALLRRKNSIPLTISHPDICKEWDVIKNGALTPDSITASYSKKVWWVCPKGHSYDLAVKNRTQMNCNCPYCSGKRILVGYNDLQTTYPEIAAEWHPTKNGDLKPTDVSIGTNKKVWWLGKCGHEWEANIWPRKKGVGCPKCKMELHTSFSEQAVYYYVKKYYPDAINGDKNAIGMELDIYIPSESVGIEYDGQAYHSPNRKTDVKKNQVCKDKGICLIRIQETDKYEYDDCICIVRSKDRSKDDLTLVIRQVLSLLGHDNVDVDVVRDESAILETYMSIKKQNSLLIVCPELAAEWHPTKNGNLTPDKIISGSMQSVWWLGKCGHEWQARLNNRKRGVGCPYCSGQLPIKGQTDFVTMCPELSKEWDYEKNGDFKPTEVTAGSTRLVWWKGLCGHEWKASPYNRKKGQGCPYCSNHKLLTGFNDVASRYPDIAKEWHPIKNGDLTPDKVCYGSGTKVWWLGECGHEWQVRVVDRTVTGHGCPYCKKSFGVRVLCVETGTIYDNLTEAANDMHTHKASIVNCCKGRQNKAGGYHWKYVDKE